MANGDIRQKIVLEGEKEYSAALKEAQRNLKVLRSELKAETAELGKNASEQQKNEVRTRNLQKQIKEQEKVVRTYEKALEEVRARYGDNEEAVAKWEVKLNDARTSLYNLKNSLDDTATSMTKVGSAAKSSGDMGVVAMNSLAQSLERVGSVGDSISSSLENAFTGIVGTIKETIGAVWGELMDIAVKSDNYMDLAAYFNTSATAVQKWDSAMKAAGGDMSTVTSLITRLKYSGKEKSVAEWFGISAENYTNDLEYFQLVMQQMVDNREEMMRAGTWDTAMADIFGTKKGFDVEGVLSDWDAILNGLDRFDADKGGFGLTEDQIQNMADLNIQVQTLKESWTALKRMATVELFGNLAMNITGNLQNIVDAFKEYFDAEDDAGREAALGKVRDNIEKMFEAIKEAIEKGIEMLGKLADELQKSEDPAVRAFGNVLEKIVNVLEWFSDESNWDTVKRGFEALIGVWAVGKIAKAVGNITSFAASVKTIMGGGSKLFSYAEGISETGSAAGGLVSGSGLANVLWGAAPLAVFVASMAPAVIQQLHNEENWKQEQEGLENTGNELIESGDTANGAFIKLAAKTTGPEKYADGTYVRNGLGGLVVRPTDEQAEQLMGLKGRTGQQYAELMTALTLYGRNRTGDYTYQALQDFWKSGGEGFDAMTITTLIEDIAYALDQYSHSGMNESDYQKRESAGRRRLPDGWAYNEYGSIYNTETGKRLSNNYDIWDDRTFYEWYKEQQLLWNNTHSGIPADDWSGTGGGINAEISEASANLIGTSVKGAVSGIQVLMDGTVVGHLVAPVVSQDIAREAALP